MIEKKDLEKFKRLQVDSILELACIAPSSVENRSIQTQPRFNQVGVVDVEILEFIQMPRHIKLVCYAFNFEEEIDAIVFNPKPFHRRTFPIGKRLLLQGKLQQNFQKTQVVQPKVIAKAEGIHTQYKTELRNDSFSRLIKKYITAQNLKMLPTEVSEALLKLHFPKEAEPLEQFLYALKYAELYDYLGKLNVKRRYFEALAVLNSSIHEWVAALPFTLTNDQQRAISDIQQDLQKDVAAKRIIVGDVGCGKTMVILASVMCCFPKKAALMAPTTILANQLFEEAQKFLPESIKLALVTNKTKKIDLSAYDFIIGTHALLYRELPECALVMIDEQHRFGTKQRNMLEKLVNDGAKRPHFLQFSATPIPRTQAMIDSSLVDISMIEQTPYKKDIDTTVIHKQDFKTLLAHIKEEISKNNQVLLVYPLVEESETLAYQSLEEARGYWEKHFENVFVTHGKDKDKEQVLLDFREGGNILLATTVVEVGISLPRLTTVVIVGAERLGLATLHQLRGRVSRTGLKGYCYLYTNQKESARLEQFCHTTNGFDIASLDLKFRNSGDMLRGHIQSGKAFKWVDLAEDEKIVQRVKQELKKALV